MLFIVPDDSDETREAPEAAGQIKAQLDEGESAGRETKKVELDLDDAPFLEEEEEEEVVEEVIPQPQLEEEKPPRQAPAWLKNKFLWIGLAVALVLISVVVKFLFFNKPAPVPPPSVEEQKAEPAPPPPVEEAKPKDEGETILRLDPFWVEQKDKNGDIRFLVVRIVFSTKDQNLAKNLTQETITVRNAVYYYLKNKDLQFLADEKNAERLKKELLTVVNQYMGAGQFENLLFEEYVVK